MRLNELLEGLGMEMRALKDLEITGLTADSRRVEPGFLFAALPGSEADGRDFIPDAVVRGATAVLAPPGTELGEVHHGPDGAPVQLLTDDNPRRRFAQIAARFFGTQPDVVVAVTGTNGKTSVAQFTRQIWAATGRHAAAMGTLGVVSDVIAQSGSLTTPDPVSLHELLATLADRGVDHLALEASSHGLDQCRLDGVRISAAAFTNISRDHLDYHGSMDAYLAAKVRLFSEVMVPGGIAVLNADSPHVDVFEEACRSQGHSIIRYGHAGDALKLENVVPLDHGQLLDLTVCGKVYRIELPLVGEFQVMNVLAALGLALADGSDTDDAIATLEKLSGAPGRLELAGATAEGATVFVDYAHTPDALETALKALRPHTRGRLHVVFGCGGNRDKGKRPIMGEIAARDADAVIVTDDNPRREDAAAIRAQVMQGCPDAEEIGDRMDAIQTAVDRLAPGDTLLIAGKGHETGQIVGTETIPFDDREAARTALGVKDGAS